MNDDLTYILNNMKVQLETIFTPSISTQIPSRNDFIIANCGKVIRDISAVTGDDDKFDSNGSPPKDDRYYVIVLMTLDGIILIGLISTEIGRNKTCRNMEIALTTWNMFTMSLAE